MRAIKGNHFANQFRRRIDAAVRKGEIENVASGAFGEEVLADGGETIAAYPVAEMLRQRAKSAPGEIFLQIERVVEIEDNNFCFDLNQGIPPRRSEAS